MAHVTDTAAAVARLRAEEAERPAGERLFDDPYAALFAGGAGADEVAERFLQVPYIRESIRLRTRFIDDVVRQSLAGGVRQIVILGAGFDCRALRLREVCACRAVAYEVDFAAQLERKAARLAAAGVELPSWLACIPSDLGAEGFDSRLRADLYARAFSPTAPALFIWEGVLGYLDDAAVDRTLRLMASAGGRRSRAVLNYNLSRITPAALAARAIAAGFVDVEDDGLATLHRRLLAGEPAPESALYRIAVLRT
jgi:methyltransferase (TIGR00027 family)